MTEYYEDLTDYRIEPFAVYGGWLNWLRALLARRDVHMIFLLDHKWDALRSSEQSNRSKNSALLLSPKS